MTTGAPVGDRTERGPGLGRVLSFVSQTVSVQSLRSVAADPLFVTVNRTVMTAPYTACDGTTTFDVTRSESGCASTNTALAVKSFASFGYSSTAFVASAMTRKKPGPRNRSGMIALVVDDAYASPTPSAAPLSSDAIRMSSALGLSSSERKTRSVQCGVLVATEPKLRTVNATAAVAPAVTWSGAVIVCTCRSGRGFSDKTSTASSSVVLSAGSGLPSKTVLRESVVTPTCQAPSVRAGS